ncbi:MAG TPA: hypothetical protein VGM23_07505 [Armatimonadota bacterium]|jgi:hypothetical protein
MKPFVAGGLLLLGLAAIAWLLYRHENASLTPLDEADRRIGELEKSLHRLQTSFIDLG